MLICLCLSDIYFPTNAAMVKIARQSSSSLRLVDKNECKFIDHQ